MSVSMIDHYNQLGSGSCRCNPYTQKIHFAPKLCMAKEKQKIHGGRIWARDRQGKNGKGYKEFAVATIENMFLLLHNGLSWQNNYDWYEVIDDGHPCRMFLDIEIFKHYVEYT